MKEYCRQAMAEKMVDGFLLMSMTDSDMAGHLGKCVVELLMIYLNT